MNNLLSKIKRICRVCLEEKDEMLSLYDGNIISSYSAPLSCLIMECASIKVSKDDGLPTQLCNVCFNRLELAYLFKRDCEESDSTLRHCIKHNIETIEKIDFTIKHESNETELQNFHDSSTSSDPISLMVQVEMNVSENEVLNFGSDSEQTYVEGNIHREIYLQPTDSNLKNLEEPSLVTTQDTLECTKGQFTCPICRKKFDLKSNMIAHVWQHHPPDKEKLECGKQKTSQTIGHTNESDVSSNEEELGKKRKRRIKKCKKSRRIRVPTKIKSLKYICYICGKSFNTKNDYEGHKNEHPNQRYICDFENCDQEFEEYLAYATHRKNDHSVENYLSCPECERTFNSKKNLDNHLVNKHIDDRPFGCLHCSKTFREKWTLDAHLNTHSKNYKCQYCEKLFATSLRLANHMRVHTKDKPFTCDDCGRNFSQKSNLDKHVNSFHKGIKRSRKEKNHLCPHCGQTFGRPVDLTTHIRTHTGIKPFSCDKCEYRCHDKQLLRSHVRKHTGVRPYKCSYCEKSFGTRSYLTIHERFHSGVRPYICSNISCQKGFTNSKDLKVHERTHTGIKLFTCNICSNSFTTLHYLRVHTKKHEDI